MIILGINGWHTRSHDSSACIIKDGKILVIAEEERFIRQKHAFDKIPINAISYCLKTTKITADDVNIVAFGWNYKLQYNLCGRKFNYNNDKLLDVLFPRKIFNYRQNPKLIVVSHHLAHAASVFFTSGLQESSILVMDGQGENVSTSIAYGHNKLIKILKSFPIQDSLGYFYESINKYIGFHYSDSGKTMGLAPYGKPIYKFSNIKISNNTYEVRLPNKLHYDSGHIDQQETLVKLWFKQIKKTIKEPNTISYKFNSSKNRIVPVFHISQKYKNLAASAQRVLEKVINHLADTAIKMTKCNNLCISGGVGLNCMANGKLLRKLKTDHLYVFPVTNDAGVSVGAALYASSLYDKNAKFSKLENVYFGPDYTNNQVKKILDKRKIKYKILHNIYKETAQLLKKDKIIGWFQGKMEAGPRALGNRSILASPLKKIMWRKVNKIKNRESWRPLAPSILDEYKDEYFENAQYSPFMLKTFFVKKSKQSSIPAVVHINGSTRPQTVSKKTNKKLWLLINEFRKITGVPVLLNTSFNGLGEPIICTPQEAIAMFYNSGLDYLIINNYIIQKL